MSAIIEDDLSRLRHMVGAGNHISESKYGYRNLYAARSAEQNESMDRLKNAGYAEKFAEAPNISFFRATKAGCKAIGLTPAQTKRVLEKK